MVAMLESIIGQELARPRFMKVDDLIENGFTRRCLGTIVDSWQERESRVIAAVPFSGKSRLLKHLIDNSGAYKDDSIEETRMPLIGVVTPKSRTEAALGNKIASELGALVNMTWAQRREWLFHALIVVQSEMLVVDDAQDLSLEQLRYLKEIYDTLMLKGHRIAICYLSASDGRAIPLQETLENSTLVLQRQFERRLDIDHRYCQIDNNNEGEVTEILDAYQRAYRPQFPNLTLVPYAPSIYRYLVDPRVDIEGTKRVTMGNIEAFVVACLKRAFAQSLPDVTEDIIFDVAGVMALRRNELIHIAAAGTGDGEASGGAEMRKGA